MRQLIILDYSTTTVHFYQVADYIAINEEYIEKLGHHASNCEWMVGNNIDTVNHIGIQK